MNTTIKNPYVGPRTFRKEDRELFFGRDREARDLMSLVSSGRLILLYAQSGTGKSSILNTRLIPELEENDFEVLPVGRVQGEIQEGFQIENIYAYNLMSSLVQQSMDLKALAKLSLSQFLARLDFNDEGYFYNKKARPKNSEDFTWRRVLVIDQFEEIFTTHMDAWAKREGFFQQLTQAMKDDSSLTVILVMREDYIASLDPYAHLLPDGVRTRYYMQRLTREMALKAIKSPVERVRPFEDGVAEKLVEDLSSILINKPGDVQEVYSGQYVEPVQLQVVCYSLWESLSSSGDRITEADLSDIGDVNQSLEKFYDQRVGTVAKQQDVSERLIREWFEKDLITNNKTRNMVLRSANGKALIEEEVIQLLKGDLVREELRAGQIWYELTHDRLVEPVLASNAKWFEQHLSLFQRQADLWVRQGRSEGLLLRGQELEQAEKDAESLELTNDERAFMEACHSLRAREQRERRRNTLLTILAIGATIAMIVAGVFWTQAQSSASEAVVAASTAQAASTLAVEQKDIAQSAEQDAVDARAETESTLKKTEIELRKARNQQLSAQAELTSKTYPSRSLLLALEAIRINTDANEPVAYTAKQALLNGLKSSEGTPLSGNTSDILILKFSPSGRWLATGAKNGDILIWDRESSNFPNKPAYSIQTTIKEIKYLVFSGDSQILAAAGTGQNIYLFNLSNLSDDNPSINMFNLEINLPAIEGLETSSDGKWLATGNAASITRKVLLWDLVKIWDEKETTPKELTIFVGDTTLNDTFVKFTLEFSPDSKYLLASDGYHSKLWSFSLDDIPIEQPQVDDTFHPPDNLTKGWQLTSSGWIPHTTYYIPSSESAQIHWIGFTPDSRKIIAGTALSIRDTTPRLFIWPVNAFNNYSYDPYFGAYGVRPNYHSIDGIWEFDIVTLSSDDKWLATSSGSDIFVQDLENNESFILRNHQGSITNLEFSKDGHWLFSASPLTNGDGTTRLWDMTATDIDSSARVYTISSEISAADIDPEEEWVAVSSENRLVRLLPINTSGKDWKEYYASIMGLEKNGLQFYDLKSDGTWSSYGYSFYDAEGKSYSNHFIIVNGQSQLDEGGWFSQDGQWLIQASREIIVHNLQEKEFTTAKYNVPFACNGHVGYFKDNSRAYVNCGDGGSILFNLEDRPVKGKTMDGIKALAGSPDGKWLAGWSSGTKTDLALFDISQETITSDPIVLIPYAKEIQTVRFSVDSKWVIVSKFPDGESCGVNEVGEYGCPSERDILIWNFLDSDPKVPDYSLTVPEPEKINFSNDGRWIGILANGAGKLVDLSQASVKEYDLQTFVPEGTILQLSFSQDNHWLALLDESGHITLVNLQAPDLKVIKPNTLFYKIAYLTFGLNSDILTGTTEFDDSLIWELSSILEDPSSIPVVSTVGKFMTSDGKWLFSLNYDDLLKAVCPSIGRNLTRNEWELYGFTEDYRATCPQFAVEEE